jgi:RNA polymerase sigma-70 factor (ECF subfamily)
MNENQQFENTVLPHLDAAYNLARWMTRNDHDAEDVVQDAMLRAFKFFGGFRGGNSRSWLLTIVRNACLDWFEKNRKLEFSATLDDGLHAIADEASGPEVNLLRKADRALVRQAIDELPVEFREIIVLREMEDLSYKEISDVAGIPIGTVMSRLARARKLLQRSLGEQLQPEGPK